MPSFFAKKGEEKREGGLFLAAAVTTQENRVSEDVRNGCLSGLGGGSSREYRNSRICQGRP